MAWVIKVTKTAIKQLKNIHPKDQERILVFLENRVASLADPREMGRPLVGEKRGLWRYRVGDYRLICDIQDTELIIAILAVGHRKNVHRH